MIREKKLQEDKQEQRKQIGEIEDKNVQKKNAIMYRRAQKERVLNI